MWFDTTIFANLSQHSTCHKFGAMGYSGHWGAVSGMVLMTCSRHNFVLPSSAVDLQKGERYVSFCAVSRCILTLFRFANVDLALISATVPWLSLPRHVLSYDIACQYIVKFLERLRQALVLMSDLDHIDVEDIQRLMKLAIVPTVPKFHAPAHKRECRVNFSLDYIVGSGRTDGEAVERTWSEQNGLALSTKEMARGHRHDVINYHHGLVNDRKVTTIGSSLSFPLMYALLSTTGSNSSSTPSQGCAKNLAPSTRTSRGA